MQRLAIVLLVLLLPGSSGCNESLPDSAAELKDVAVDSRDRAEKARKAGEPEDAAVAAERAEAAVARLIEIHDAAKQLTDDDKALRKTAVLAAREARHFAELAREEKERADALDSWKATGYRTARKLAWKGTFEALALAAEQADGKDLKTLSPGVRDSALLAADLANASHSTDESLFYELTDVYVTSGAVGRPLARRGVVVPGLGRAAWCLNRDRASCGENPIPVDRFGLA